MNELELLERFRHDLKEPSDEVIRVAEQRLNRTMSGPTLGPARGPARRQGWRIPAVLAAALALVLVALALPPGTTGGIDHAAAAQLRRFASISLNAREAEVVLGPGQYLYESSESRSLNVFYSGQTGISFRYYIDDAQESWNSLDGSGRTEGQTSQPEFVAEEDRLAYQEYEASGVMEDEWGGKGSFGWNESYGKTWDAGERPLRDFSQLPTDVAELEGMIENREIIGGPEGDWETFNLSADVLTWGYAPPELRAAVFEVMANLPGVELLGQTEDALGRSGIAVGYTHDAERQELVFERGTARLLERRWVSVSGDWDIPESREAYCGDPECVGAGQWLATGPPGTVSSVTTYEVYGEVVDGIGDRSAA